MHTTATEQAEPQPVATPTLLGQCAWTVSDILVIARRNLLRYIRLPQLLVFSTIQPVMLVILFTFVFGGAIPTPGIDYINYLIPGIMAQAVLFGSVQTAVGLAEDLNGGMVDRFRSLPMARSAVLAGRTLADSVRNTFVVLLMIGVGTVFGFRFQNGFLPAVGAIALVVLFGFAVCWISAIIGLLTKNPETAQTAMFVWMFPLVFASSVFVPVETMPGWLQAFADVQPVSVTVNGMRAMTLGGSMTPVWQALLWIGGLLAVAIPLAVAQYRRST